MRGSSKEGSALGSLDYWIKLHTHDTKRVVRWVWINHHHHTNTLTTSTTPPPPPPLLLTLSPTTPATQILLSGGWTEGELGKHWQGKSSSLSDNLDATYHHDLNDLEIVPFHFLLTNWLVQPSSTILINLRITSMIIRKMIKSSVKS